MELPEGFHVEVFAEIKEPRQLALSSSSQNLYVGSRLDGSVRVVTKDKSIFLIASGLEQPTGLALKGFFLIFF